MSCTLQMLYCHEDLLRPREACNCRLQSDDESCPVQAKIHRIPFCSHPKGGKNPQSHLASSGKLSNLRQQFSDHSTLQIRPNHQDWFSTLHWSLYRTGKFRHSSCKLKIERPVWHVRLLEKENCKWNSDSSEFPHETCTSDMMIWESYTQTYCLILIRKFMNSLLLSCWWFRALLFHSGYGIVGFTYSSES